MPDTRYARAKPILSPVEGLYFFFTRTMEAGVLAVVVIFLASVCKVNSDICTYTNYYGYSSVSVCSFGCCEDGCCPVSAGVIVGPTVGGVVLIAAIVGIVLVYRRRKRAAAAAATTAAAAGGVVEQRSQPQIVVQQSTTMNQSGAQPGVMYPTHPHYPAYPPPNYGYPVMAPLPPSAPAYQPPPMSNIHNQNQITVN